MKVLCIQAANYGTYAHLNRIVEGEIYEVCREGSYDWFGKDIPSYELFIHPKVWYMQSLFVRLSDIDETEIIRTYTKEKISL